MSSSRGPTNEWSDQRRLACGRASWRASWRAAGGQLVCSRGSLRARDPDPLDTPSRWDGLGPAPACSPLAGGAFSLHVDCVVGGVCGYVLVGQSALCAIFRGMPLARAHRLWGIRCSPLRLRGGVGESNVSAAVCPSSTRPLVVRFCTCGPCCVPHVILVCRLVSWLLEIQRAFTVRA